MRSYGAHGRKRSLAWFEVKKATFEVFSMGSVLHLGISMAFWWQWEDRRMLKYCLYNVKGLGKVTAYDHITIAMLRIDKMPSRHLKRSNDCAN